MMNPNSAAAENPQTTFRSLPCPITRENKYPAGLLMFFVGAAIYLTTNHYHLFPPQMLPMSWVDLRVPFIPQTVWIYTSEYLLFAAAWILVRDVVNLNRFMY